MTERTMADFQEQLGRIDERTLGTQRDLGGLRTLLEQHRIEHRSEYEELKKIISDGTVATNTKVQEHERALIRINRDQTWVHGIFVLLWTGLFSWVKFFK